MTTIKTKNGTVFVGPCLICGTKINNEDGRGLDCYNAECQEYRKNLVVPEGWTITPFVKSFELNDEKPKSLKEQIDQCSNGWTYQNLGQWKVFTQEQLKQGEEE